MVQNLSTQNQKLHEKLSTRVQALEAAQARPNLEGDFVQDRALRGNARRRASASECPMTIGEFIACEQL